MKELIEKARTVAYDIVSLTGEAYTEFGFEERERLLQASIILSRYANALELKLVVLRQK